MSTGHIAHGDCVESRIQSAGSGNPVCCPICDAELVQGETKQIIWTHTIVKDSEILKGLTEYVVDSESLCYTKSYPQSAQGGGVGQSPFTVIQISGLGGTD